MLSDVEASRALIASPSRDWTAAGSVRSVRPKFIAVSLAGRFATGITLLFAAFVVLSTLAFTILSHGPLPRGDEWDSLALFDRIFQKGGAWSDLFSPHNEHRLFVPRLVFYSDYLLFGGRGLLDKAAIVVIQFAHLGLLTWLIRRSGAGPVARWALAAAAAVLLFSLRQAENFEWDFQVQFVAVFACASLSCILFAFAIEADRADRPCVKLLAPAFALALAATFTMANGLLTGIALTVMACLARARGRVTLVTVGAAATLMLLFSLGYHLTDDHAGAADMLRAIPAEIAFTAGYLGNFAPFGLQSEIALGASGLAATLVLAARMAAERKVPPAQLALLGIALFAAGSAAVTALGRSGSGLGEIEASRYTTGSAIFWAATLTNGWTFARGGPVRSVSRALVSAVALLLLVACGSEQMRDGSGMEARAVAYGAIEDAILLDLLDVPALDAFQEPIDSVRQGIPVLRERRLSIFGSRDAGRVGRLLSRVEAAGAPQIPCFGTFDTARAVPTLGRDGAAVSGFSSLRSRFGRPARIYIVDAGRIVVGLARTGFGGGAWKGYARAPAGTQLGAYAVSDAGRTCSVGSVVVSPAG